MKIKPKKALVLLTTAIVLTTISTPAFSASISDTFAQFIKTQKGSVFGVPVEKLTSYVSPTGEINMNSVFTDLSRKAYDWVKGTGDVAGVKTAGDQAADLNQERAEISHQGNTQSTAKSTKYFQDNIEEVQQLIAANETPSDSSLEATDKSNKLASASVITSQQLTKATLDLTLAQQNQNSINIEKGQKAQTDRIKDQIDSRFHQNEFERLQTVARRRYYPDANGKMVEGNADASTRVFNGK